MLEKVIQPAIEERFVIRPPTMDDIPAATELFNLCSMEEVGRAQLGPEEVRWEWELPGFDLTTDMRLVFTPKGKLVGYVEVWDTHSLHVSMFAWCRVHPDYRGQGIGSWLMQFTEDRARRSIPLAPEDARVVLRGWANSVATPTKALLEAQGYMLTQHSLRMSIDLDQAPPAPVVPEGLTVRVYDPERDDMADIYRADNEAFKDHRGHVETPFEEGFPRWKHWWENNPHYDPSLWFLAMDGDQIAGVSLCQTCIAEDPEMGWVDSLGVRRPWRRRGVALALLQHSFGEFYRRGQPRAGLGVDASSLTGATRLYEKAGMKSIRQYDGYEKELRAGEDLTLQTLTPQGET